MLVSSGYSLLCWSRSRRGRRRGGGGLGRRPASRSRCLHRNGRRELGGVAGVLVGGGGGDELADRDRLRWEKAERGVAAPVGRDAGLPDEGLALVAGGVGVEADDEAGSGSAGEAGG